MDRKIIFFDIDGTLIDCQKGHDFLTEYTKKALKQLKDDGHYIFIASGRPYCYLMDELLEFDFDGYILSDGAYVLFKGQELSYHPLDAEVLKPMVKTAEEKNMIYIAYNRKNAYFFNDNGSLLEYCKTFKFNDKCVDYVDTIDEIINDVTKIHLQALNEDDYMEMDIDLNLFYTGNDDNHFLKEIYGKKYSKATALKEILDYTGLSIENSYFFGDGKNDIEMMDVIGHPIAMDNASDEVKAHADYICKSVAEDGVADFIFNSGLF